MSERTSISPQTRPFGPSARVRRAEAAEGEQAGDDFFVLDLNSGKYYSLGEVGGFIWMRLNGDDSLSQVAQAVARDFDVEGRQAEEDVLEFVGMLDGLGLIAAE